MSSNIRELISLYETANTHPLTITEDFYRPILDRILPNWFTAVYQRSDLPNPGESEWVRMMTELWTSTFFSEDRQPLSLITNDIERGTWYMKDEYVASVYSAIVPCFTASRMHIESVYEVCYMVRYLCLLGTMSCMSNFIRECIPMYTTVQIYRRGSEMFRYVEQRDVWILTKKNNDDYYKWMVPLSMKNTRLEPLPYNNEEDPNVQQLVREAEEDDDTLPLANEVSANRNAPSSSSSSSDSSSGEETEEEEDDRTEVSIENGWRI